VPRAALYDMKAGNDGHGSWSRWQKALYNPEAPLTAAAFEQGRRAYRGPHALLAELRLDKMDAKTLRARAEAAGVAEDSVEEAEGKPEPLHALRMLNLQVEEGRRRLAAGIAGAVMKGDIAQAEELLGAVRGRKVPYYTAPHTTPHTTRQLNKNREAFGQRKHLPPRRGLYPIVTSQYSLTTVYQFSYRIR
jgi:hypothetical protein